jgi:predicted secreted Zn-dependent protease
MEDYERMEHMTREEYLASLRRRSSGFARGVSKYRGVARSHYSDFYTDIILATRNISVASLPKCHQIK